MKLVEIDDAGTKQRLQEVIILKLTRPFYWVFTPDLELFKEIVANKKRVPISAIESTLVTLQKVSILFNDNNFGFGNPSQYEFVIALVYFGASVEDIKSLVPVTEDEILNYIQEFNLKPKLNPMLSKEIIQELQNLRIKYGEFKELFEGYEFNIRLRKWEQEMLKR